MPTRPVSRQRRGDELGRAGCAPARIPEPAPGDRRGDRKPLAQRAWEGNVARHESWRARTDSRIVLFRFARTSADSLLTEGTTGGIAPGGWIRANRPRR